MDSLRFSFLYIANWKMQLSFTQAELFLKTYADGLSSLAELPATKIVICPSFEMLYTACQMLKNTKVQVGAQDCAPALKGAYTGQVSACSLKEIGCSYTIIGHSEQRMHTRDSNECIARKVRVLLEEGITPIVCVGEQYEDYCNNNVLSVIKQQLTPVWEVLMKLPALASQRIVCIAYEPVWAIGTGVMPALEYIAYVFSEIARMVPSNNPIPAVCLLYGGSVTDENHILLRKIPLLRGFLLGGASLNFQKFQKIVS